MNKFFMNPETGSVDTWENWVEDSKTWDSDSCASIADQLNSLIEVEKDENGDWTEV